MMMVCRLFVVLDKTGELEFRSKATTSGLSIVLNDVRNLSTDLQSFKEQSGKTFELIQEQIETRVKQVRDEIETRVKEVRGEIELREQVVLEQMKHNVADMIDFVNKKIEEDRRKVVQLELSLREKQLKEIVPSVQNECAEVGETTSQGRGGRHGQGRGQEQRMGHHEVPRASTSQGSLSRPVRSCRK